MANQLDDVTIHQFRALKDLTLSGLGSVNILVGDNNSGKTSILEALAIYARAYDLNEWTNTALRREVKAARRPYIDAIKWLFPQVQSAEAEHGRGEIHISSQGKYHIVDMKAHFEEIFRLAGTKGQKLAELSDHDEGDMEPGMYLTVQLQERLPTSSVINSHERVFEIWNTQNKPYAKRRYPFIPVATITPVTHRIEQISGISDVIKNKSIDDIRTALTMFDPGVQGIAIVAPQGALPTIEIEHADFETTVPVSAFGDGMRRALTFAVTIPKVKNGLLLIDEIETAIHVSALQQLYTWLVQVCQINNIQLFVTTHSLEAVDALLCAHKEPYEGLVTYQLGQAGQPPKRFSGELLSRLRNERGLDVR